MFSYPDDGAAVAWLTISKNIQNTVIKNLGLRQRVVSIRELPMLVIVHQKQTRSIGLNQIGPVNRLTDLLHQAGREQVGRHWIGYNYLIASAGHDLITIVPNKKRHCGAFTALTDKFGLCHS
jgi:hypothetical protein